MGSVLHKSAQEIASMNVSEAQIEREAKRFRFRDYVDVQIIVFQAYSKEISESQAKAILNRYQMADQKDEEVKG